jgi:hypothetical protein
LLAAVVTALFVLPFGSSAQVDSRLRPATPLDPISAILDAFVTHDVVALGDVHHDAQLHELRMKLIEDPRFPDVVRDIVFEFGTSQHQALLDRYVDGGDVTPNELRLVSEEGMFNAVWDHGPVYRDFFAAVRALNAKLPEERRIRIVLAEPEPRTMEAEAAIIRRETTAKGRKALLVIGGMHFPRKPIYMPVSNREFAEFMFNHPWSVSTTAHLEAAGVSVFSIYPVPVDELATAQGDAAQWSTPALAVVAGTPLGAEPFATFAPTDTLVSVPDADGDGEHTEQVLPDPARSGLTQEQFDAVIALAPSLLQVE